MFAELFTIIAPVFICGGIGFVWARLDIGYPTDFVSRLVINIGAPCLVFNGLAHLDKAAHMFGLMFTAALMLMGAMLVINISLMKLTGRPTLPLAHSLTFPNWGNLSLPLSLFAFGKEGLGLALGYFVAASLVQNTVGQMFLAGTFKPREFLRMPVIYGVVSALFFMMTGITPPLWLDHTTNLLGATMIPLMLISLGVSLATLQVGHLWRVAILVAYRLALGISLGFGIVWLFGFTGTARGVTMLAATMPVAVLNYMYAARFGRSPERVASIVFLSTLASLAAVPFMLAYLL